LAVVDFGEAVSQYLEKRDLGVGKCNVVSDHGKNLEFGIAE
jgi:hypothetical protein